jgi:hypothetical protein
VSGRAALLTRLAVAIASEPVSSPLTLRVCRAARNLLGAEGASITLESSTPNRLTLCATDKPASLLENLQDVLGEGPCRDAFDFGQPVESALDQAAFGRWPQFIPAAEVVIGREGVLWSIPMRAAGETIGAVSMYRRLPGPLVEPLEAAQYLADAVAAALIRDPLAFAAFTTTTTADGGGWSSRAQIHQASGMLASKLHISVGDALALLRSHAFTAGIELADVAAAVVERRLDLTRE